MYKDDNLDKYIHAWQERYYYVSSSVTGEVYTSEFNSFSSSSVRAGAVGKIINGGKKIIYTAATAAMLNANLAQYASLRRLAAT